MRMRERWGVPPPPLATSCGTSKLQAYWLADGDACATFTHIHTNTYVAWNGIVLAKTLVHYLEMHMAAIGLVHWRTHLPPMDIMHSVAKKRWMVPLQPRPNDGRHPERKPSEWVGGVWLHFLLMCDLITLRPLQVTVEIFISTDTSVPINIAKHCN